MAPSCLKVASWNLRGGFWDKAKDILPRLLEKCDILCLQETWLFDRMHGQVAACFPEYTVVLGSIPFRMDASQKRRTNPSKEWRSSFRSGSLFWIR